MKILGVDVFINVQNNSDKKIYYSVCFKETFQTIVKVKTGLHTPPRVIGKFKVKHFNSTTY